MDETRIDTDLTMSPLSNKLIYAQQILTWSMLAFLIFGNIGNLCNCFVFLQKPLQSNSCSNYLLVSSITNIITLTFVIPTSIYSIIQNDPMSYSLIYCKLRLYIYHCLLMISRYLIVFACIDRACLSSTRVFMRNFSQKKKARKICLIIIIVWFIVPIHIPLLITIESNICIMSDTYKLVFGIYTLIFAGTLPPLLMSIFSLITLYNLHRVRIRVHASGTQPNRLMRQRDIHLTRMLIAQVIVYVLTTTPYPLNTLYAAITVSIDKTIDRQIIETFIYFFTGQVLLFINPTVSFYIYISTSKAFRSELKTAMINLWQKVFNKQRNNIINHNVNQRFVTRTLAQQRQQQQKRPFQTSSIATIRPIPDK